MSFRNRVLGFLLACVRFQARALGLLKGRRHGLVRRVAVLEPCPSSAGSDGDEALIQGTCRFLNEQPSTVVEVISFIDGYEGPVPVNTRYGGSLYRRADTTFRKVFRHFAWPFFFAKYDDLYIIGADLIDGYYAESVSVFLFQLLKLVENLGCRGHLISCSFNDRSPPAVRKAARKFLKGVRVHARDVYSANRLSEILGRPVSSSADVAFGLLPEVTENGRKAVDWIRKEKAAARTAIALNVNLLPIKRQCSEKEEAYLLHWGNWIDGMVRRGYSFVLLPHDYRDEVSDEKALVKALDNTTPDLRMHCFLPSERLHAGEIKYIVGHCALTVTGRMHLAIASMGMGVPVIAYAYQAKFEGILRLFGIENNVRPIEKIFEDVTSEIEIADQTARRVSDIQARVKAQTDAVLSLARMNIADFCGSSSSEVK